MTLTPRRSRYLRGLCRHFGMIVRDLGATTVASADMRLPRPVEVATAGRNLTPKALTGPSPALVGME